MKYFIKLVVGAVATLLISNVYAVSTQMDVGLYALVQASCNTADAFVLDQDLSIQINGNGGIDSTDGRDLPITNGAIIGCNASPTWTTLNMVSLNGGLMNGALVLPYKIKGTFGDGTDNTGGDPITITPFDSKIGPATDLLAGTGITPEGTPNLTVHLNDQADGVALAGNYYDTLTLTVITNP
jgi:hypothetical protein